MIEENDIIKVKIDLNDLIKINTLGVVLSVYDNGNSFLIEFVDNNNETIGSGMEVVQLKNIELVFKFKR